MSVNLSLHLATRLNQHIIWQNSSDGTSFVVTDVNIPEHLRVRVAAPLQTYSIRPNTFDRIE